MVASTSSCVGSAASGKGIVVLAHLQIVEDEIWTTILLLSQQKTVFWLGQWNNWPGILINQRSGSMVKVAVIFWFEKVAGKILYFGVLKRLLWLSFKIQGAQLGRTPCKVKGHLTDGIVLLIVVGGSRTSCDRVEGVLAEYGEYSSESVGHRQLSTVRRSIAISPARLT